MSYFRMIRALYSAHYHSIAHSGHFNSLEHCICTTQMTDIRPVRKSNPEIRVKTGPNKPSGLASLIVWSPVARLGIHTNSIRTGRFLRFVAFLGMSKNSLQAEERSTLFILTTALKNSTIISTVIVSMPCRFSKLFYGPGVCLNAVRMFIRACLSP